MITVYYCCGCKHIPRSKFCRKNCKSGAWEQTAYFWNSEDALKWMRNLKYY